MRGGVCGERPKTGPRSVLGKVIDGAQPLPLHSDAQENHEISHVRNVTRKPFKLSGDKSL